MATSELVRTKCTYGIGGSCLAEIPRTSVVGASVRDLMFRMSSCPQSTETAERTGATTVGPVPLPTKIERFTVRRSTFIDKDSHEHFEIRTHKRLIDVVDPDSKTIDTLMRLNLPAGVDIEIKL